MDLSSSLLVLSVLGIVGGQGGYWWLGSAGVFGGAEIEQLIDQDNSGIHLIRLS